MDIMRKMKTVNISVNQLAKGGSSELTSTDEEAAEVLCDFFKSVFTTEQGEPTAKVGNENIYEQKPVLFDIDTVRNKLINSSLINHRDLMDCIL